jgi:hypothetical protein
VGTTGVAISPDQTRIVGINGTLKPPRHVKIWDRASTQLRTSIEQPSVYGPFIGSDRKLMLASGWFEDISASARIGLGLRLLLWVILRPSWRPHQGAFLVSCSFMS